MPADDKIRQRLTKIEELMLSMKELFNSDGVIDKEEKVQLLLLESYIDKIKSSLSDSGSDSSTKGTPAPGDTDKPKTGGTIPPVTGEKVSRLRGLVSEIPTKGLKKGGKKASTDRAKASEAAIKEKSAALSASAQKNQVPVNLLSAIISRETDGKSSLKSLTDFETTPAKHFKKITGIITKNLTGYNFKDKNAFLASKYGKYKLSDLPGLNATDKVWGDHAHGFGITQFDIRWHATKVLDVLTNKSVSKAEDALINLSGELIAKELKYAKKKHPNWTEAQQLQAAIAAYNGGGSVHKNMTKFDADTLNSHTTGGDYSADVVARAQYFKDGSEGGENPAGGDDNKPSDTGSGDSPKPSSSDTTIKVERGMTLYSIAKKHGITVDQLKEWNNITNADRIDIGQELIVQKGGGAAPDASDSDDSGTKPAAPTGKYYSHRNASKVKIKYGAHAVKLNSNAEGLIKSIAAAAGVRSIRITSTKRTYADQARINYEQNSGKQIRKWYGEGRYRVWKKYKREGKPTSAYAAFLERYDKKNGTLISKHIPGYALDVAPFNAKIKAQCDKLIPVAGSGVKSNLKEKGCCHIVFTFKVT